MSFNNIDTKHPRYPVHGNFVLKISPGLTRILKPIGRFVDILPIIKRVNITTSDFKLERLKGERVRLCSADYMMEGYATPCLPYMPIPDTIISKIEDYALLDDLAYYNSQLEEHQLASGSSIITEAHETPIYANGHIFPPPARRTFPASIYSSRDSSWISDNYIGAIFVDRIALPLQTFFQFLQTEPYFIRRTLSPSMQQPPRDPPRDPTGITTLFPRRLAFVRQRVEEVYPDFPASELVRTFLTSRMVEWLESASVRMTRAEMYLVLFREEVMGVRNAEELGEKVVKKAEEMMTTFKSIKSKLKKSQ